MDIQEVQAVDAHCHYGTDFFDESGDLTSASRGDVDEIVRRARSANVQLSIASPLTGLWPRFGADPVAANEQARDDLADHKEMRQWVVVDPLLKEISYG